MFKQQLVCISGHYIQACPTNGDPSYDFRFSKHPTGVLKATCEMGVVSSPIIVTAQRFLKELSCPLCKDAMKDAVYMRCCFSSFCDQCKFILLRLLHSVLVLLYTTHFFFQRNCEDCTNNFIIKINKDGTTWLNRRSSSSYICKLGL